MPGEMPTAGGMVPSSASHSRGSVSKSAPSSRRSISNAETHPAGPAHEIAVCDAGTAPVADERDTLERFERAHKTGSPNAGQLRC